MNDELKRALEACETDLDGALKRLSGNEALYEDCLNEFLNDQTMYELSRTITEQAWDDAFTAAHALKGLAGNMGFVPLFHATAQLVVLIRAGRINEIAASQKQVRSFYKEIVDVIRLYSML